MANRRVPTELKKLKGTNQPCRDKDKLPPLPPGAPEPPTASWWSAEHQQAWDDHVAIIPKEVLSPIYGAALECLVCAYVDLARARRDADPPTYKTKNGLVKTHPAVRMVASNDRRYSAWLAKFGLTPSDRSKVSAVLDNEKVSPWANLTRD